MNRDDARLMDRLTAERDAALAEVARLTPNAAAWDALMAVIEDDTGSVVLANVGYKRMRRMWWSQGEWHTNAAGRLGGSFTTELYRGDDPLAALASLTAEAQS